MVVGLLALQGAFAAHRAVFERLGADCVDIRRPADLDDVAALVIPGGESTAISKLLVSSGLRDPVAAALDDGMPVLGTCAGAICLAAEVRDGRADQVTFSVIDMTVRRNGYGRQIDSFESVLSVDALGAPPFPVVAIRAPRIERVGAGVEVLASQGDDPMIVRQGSAVATTFHPELTGDDRVHEMFLSTC